MAHALLQSLSTSPSHSDYLKITKNGLDMKSASFLSTHECNLSSQNLGKTHMTIKKIKVELELISGIHFRACLAPSEGWFYSISGLIQHSLL